MPKKIIVCGCWRSGTTALYNLVRAICLRNGTVYGCFEDQYKGGNPAEWHIVKVHKFDIKWVEWADFVFTIFREPSETLESMKRFHDTGGRELDANDLLRGLAYWGLYQEHTNFLTYYPQLKRCPEKLVFKIARVLGVKPDEKKTVQQWEQIKPPETGFDPVTLLHANHITQ